MVDCRNRTIDNKILEIIIAEPDEDIKRLPKRKLSMFLLASEFFAPYFSMYYTVPAEFAAQSNSHYFGWQKVDLSQIDKEKYRPAGQKTDIDGPSADDVDRYAISEAGHFDNDINCVVYYRYVQDEDNFINTSRRMNFNHSPGVKRLILTNMGFSYCCTRHYLQKTYRNYYGFEGTNFGCEIWAHPNGIIANFDITDNIPILHECKITCKFDASYQAMHYQRLEPEGGSMGHTGGNPGTLTHYQSAPIFMRKLIDHPLLMPHWGEGPAGFKNLTFWGYCESEHFDGTIEEFFDYHNKDVIRICKDIPLLRDICCN